MTQTAHVNEDGRVYTLAIGENLWPALLAAQGPAGLHLSHTEFSWRVESGGPVSHSSRNTSMSAITDGESYALGDGFTMRSGGKGSIDGNLQRFWATANGDKLYIFARNR